MLSKKLKILNQGEIKNYHLLGIATGASFSECLYLGVKYRENFIKRLQGVRIVKNSETAKLIHNSFKKLGHKEKYMTVEFYENFA